MSSLQPIAVYGLKVPAGEGLIAASVPFSANFRITMAAIDPSDPPEHGLNGFSNGDGPARATLKLVYDPLVFGANEESDESDIGDDAYLRSMIGDIDDDESSSDEEAKNGGPSDPSKSRKARKQAAAEQMMKSLAENDSDDEMNGVSGTNGTKSKINKGKAKASSDDEDSDEEKPIAGLDEMVVCTLDPIKNYQQPLDLTICEDQRAFFKVQGSHAVYLTGNYILPAENGDHSHRHEVYDSEEDEDEEYDLSPDEDELGDDDESDELDDLEDPRITELASGDDEPPKLMKKEDSAPKGKNKRTAEDSEGEPATLDDVMSKALKPTEPTKSEPATAEPKLSKRQLKKLKNNAGKAVESPAENPNTKKVDANGKESPNGKTDKKVQFAKNLEQGPTGAGNGTKAEDSVDLKKDDSKKNGDKPKASLGLKTVQGVEIDDKKLGTGPAAKKGDKVSMRYIGKLQDGKVFDANKKGTPFTFTVGSGDVIKGWDIGVAGISKGGERRITIPSHLGYGNKKVPGIPPNSKLIFDVKLLEIK